MNNTPFIHVARNSLAESMRWPCLVDGTRVGPPADAKFLVSYEDGTAHAMTAERVSWLIDMADTIETRFSVEYLCPSGVVGVTLGKQERNEGDGDEPPFIYAIAPLVIPGGEVVGHVEYTDH